jgi:hypothetical protein
MNAKVFSHNIGTHLDYLTTAYNFLIAAYQELIYNEYNATDDNENTIRDIIVKIAKSKKQPNFPFRWITEFPNLEKNNRIDIDLATPQSLIDDEHAIKIECKIIGEAKYIDSKKSFERTQSPTNGIMSFISGKYSPKMPLAGMIGFIKAGQIEFKINKLQQRLDAHKHIITLQNLSQYIIKNDFEYSYYSQHERMNRLNKIDIYHLFFDFT